MKTVRIQIQDSLRLGTGGIHPASYALLLYAKVPPAWCASGSLTTNAMERVYEHLYGKDWRQGNSDGSRYIVQSASSRALSDAETQAKPWLNLNAAAEKFQLFTCREENGELKKTDPHAF